MKKAWLLDLDGTLIDSQGELKSLYYDVLQKNGIEGTEQEFERLVGSNSLQINHYMQEKYGITNYFSHLHQLKPVPFPYVKQVLERAAKQGIRLGIATSGSFSWARRVLKESALDDLFEAMSTGDEVARGKPAPDLYLLLLEKMDVKAEEALAFEDSLQGMESARGAGLEVLRVYPGFWEEKWKTLS